MINLTRIFEHQRSLMETLKPVEISLGYPVPPVPLDLNDRAHQQHFRLMAWFLVEELVEAKIGSSDDFPEEMADALHFAVELCILADIKPSTVESRLAAAMFEFYPTVHTFMDVITYLGRAVNLLKAKPWKKNPQLPGIITVQYHLGFALVTLLQMFYQAGIDPETEYFKKHKINEVRVQEGY